MHLYNGDCLEELQKLEDNSVDSVVTDPPYGLSFMGKKWDYDVPTKEVWLECLRVLKPGGFLLSFGGSRTYHRMTVEIEDAGFEIRDQIMWVYGSGFPKSHNVGKAIDKRGGNPQLANEIANAIKQARESRGLTVTECDKKFCNGSTNWTWYEGRKTGCRPPSTEDFAVIVKEWPELADLASKVAEVERVVLGTQKQGKLAVAPGQDNDRSQVELDITTATTSSAQSWEGWGTALKPAHEPIVMARKPFKGTVANNVLTYGTGAINIDDCRVSSDDVVTNHSKKCDSDIYGVYGNIETHQTEGQKLGRFPANFIHDGSDEVVSQFPDSKTSKSKLPKGTGGIWSDTSNTPCGPTYDGEGSAARFFYSPKASKKDRNAGCEGMAEKQYSHDGRDKPIENAYQRNNSVSSNNHPTVKPQALMAYLCRLVTQPGGLVLDPFMGSGSTGRAALAEGFDFIGVEREPEYFEIAQSRITYGGS